MFKTLIARVRRYFQVNRGPQSPCAEDRLFGFEVPARYRSPEPDAYAEFARQAWPDTFAETAHQQTYVANLAKYRALSPEQRRNTMHPVLGAPYDFSEEKSK